ncbi:unnamed protein product [Rhizoctonia solani]|uniref:DUF6532 domain-containing protein n=1 Tax=Rhizoctonia solani TaxID=456999 RepID=A0A8H3EF04_9AGAM|nr:unnamed protein product [Rhizoctonia solani]
MPDRTSDGHGLSQGREPRQRGPPPPRARPALDEIARKKKKREETAAKRVLRERIAARLQRPVTAELLRAGKVPFPVLSALPQSDDPDAAFEEEEEAYGIWCCDVARYRLGKDPYKKWRDGQLTVTEVEQLAFPGPAYLYVGYNPLQSNAPAPLDLTSSRPYYPRPPDNTDNTVPEGTTRKLPLLANQAAWTTTLPATLSKGKGTPSKGAQKGNRQQPAGSSAQKGTGATQDQYGSKAIVTDKERGNMYPGITRQPALDQPVESRFAKSVKAKQGKHAPPAPSPLHRVAYGSGSPATQAQASGYQPLRSTGGETIWDEELPPQPTTSVSQPTSTAPNVARVSHSASQPVANRSRGTREGGPNSHAAPKPTNMPTVRSGVRTTKVTEGSSRRGITNPVGVDRRERPVTVNARTHVYNNSIESSRQKNRTLNNSSGTGISHNNSTASVTVGAANAPNKPSTGILRMWKETDPLTEIELLTIEPDTALYPHPESDRIYVVNFPKALRPYLHCMNARAKVFVVAKGDYDYHSTHPSDKSKTTMDIAFDSFFWMLDKKSIKLEFDRRFTQTLPPQIRSHRTYTIKLLVPFVEQFYGFRKAVTCHEDIDANKELFEKYGDLRFIYKVPEQESKPFQHEYFLHVVRRLLYWNETCFARCYPKLFSPVPDRYLCFIATLTNRVISWFSTGRYVEGHLNEDADSRTFASIMEIIEHMRLYQRKTLWNVRSTITEFGLRHAERTLAMSVSKPAAERSWSPDAEELYESQFDPRFVDDIMNPRDPKKEDEVMNLTQIDSDDPDSGYQLNPEQFDDQDIDEFHRNKQNRANYDESFESDVDQPLEAQETLDEPDEEMMDPADAGDAGPNSIF